MSYVFAFGKEGAVREVSNPFCVCGSPFVQTAAAKTYNNKEDSAMIHCLYSPTSPTMITVIISFHFAKRGKAHPAVAVAFAAASTSTTSTVTRDSSSSSSSYHSILFLPLPFLSILIH